VRLQAFDAKRPEHEPQLERSKAPSQANLPMHVVDSMAGMLMFEKEWRDDECSMQPLSIVEPKTSAIKCHKAPFGLIVNK
jgi:hypothetical protein